MSIETLTVCPGPCPSSGISGQDSAETVSMLSNAMDSVIVLSSVLIILRPSKQIFAISFLQIFIFRDCFR